MGLFTVSIFGKNGMSLSEKIVLTVLNSGHVLFDGYD